MLNEPKPSYIYWREAMYTTIYILNREPIRVNHNKTLYELWFGRPTSVKHFKVFGSKCYRKRDYENLGKFDSIYNEDLFIGYSPKKKAYRCQNLKLHKIVESASVKVDDLKTKGVKTQDKSQSNERIRNGDEEENEELQEEE